jgi:hypothetical protein
MKKIFDNSRIIQNRFSNSYSDKFKLTTAEIELELGCKTHGKKECLCHDLSLAAVQTLALCEAGYRHGLMGKFDSEHFESDAEWKLGPGEIVKNVQSVCLDKEAPLDFYEEALFQGMKEAGLAQEN